MPASPPWPERRKPAPGAEAAAAPQRPDTPGAPNPPRPPPRIVLPPLPLPQQQEPQPPPPPPPQQQQQQQHAQEKKGTTAKPKAPKEFLANQRMKVGNLIYDRERVVGPELVHDGAAAARVDGLLERAYAALPEKARAGARVVMVRYKEHTKPHRAQQQPQPQQQQHQPQPQQEQQQQQQQQQQQEQHSFVATIRIFIPAAARADHTALMDAKAIVEGDIAAAKALRETTDETVRALDGLMVTKHGDNTHVTKAPYRNYIQQSLAGQPVRSPGALQHALKMRRGKHHCICAGLNVQEGCNLNHGVTTCPAYVDVKIFPRARRDGRVQERQVRCRSLGVLEFRQKALTPLSSYLSVGRYPSPTTPTGPATWPSSRRRSKLRARPFRGGLLSSARACLGPPIAGRGEPFVFNFAPPICVIHYVFNCAVSNVWGSQGSRGTVCVLVHRGLRASHVSPCDACCVAGFSCTCDPGTRPPESRGG